MMIPWIVCTIIVKHSDSNYWCLIADCLCRVYEKKERAFDAFDGQLASKGLCAPFKIWIGKDYVNFIVKDFSDLENPFSGVF